MTPVVFRAGEFAIERQKNTRDSVSRTANVMREDILQALYQTGSVYDDGNEDDLIEAEEQMQPDEENGNSYIRDDAQSDEENNNNNHQNNENQGDVLSIDGEKSEVESKDSRVNSEDLLASDDEYEQFAQRRD